MTMRCCGSVFRKGNQIEGGGMKRVVVLLLAAGMLCALPVGSSAIDFTAKGR